MSGYLTRVTHVCLVSFRSMQRDLGILVAFFLLFPLGFLFFLDQLVTADLRAQVLVGSVMMEAALLNINVLPQSLGSDRQTHLFDLWVTLPINPSIYVLGSALPWLPLSLATAGVTIAMGHLFFGIAVPVSVPILVGALVLVWTSTTGIGFLVAVYGGSPRQVNQLANVIGVVMTFFAPIFYSISVLPLPLQYVAYAWPPTWGAILLKDLLATQMAAAATAALVLVIYSAVGFALMALGLRWREP